MALSAFFVIGAVVAAATSLALLFPDSPLAQLWRLNPQARVGFARMGPWAAVLMGSVAVACAATARGLWSLDRKSVV